jgi:Na+/H+ antiporter NhaC
MEASWLSVLPPLLAIGTALVTKQVFLSLFAGVWLGWSILAGGDPLVGLVDAIQACIDVFKDEGNTRVIAFSSLVGSLLALTQRSGGVTGFIDWMTGRGVIANERGARLLAWVVGLGIFVESSITCLVSGAIARPLFDRFRLSREKLAYLCDSTSAPVCILIPMNGWGAFLIGILAAQQVEEPVSALVASIPVNFYSLLAVVYAFYIAFSGRDWGPMARAERRARDEGKVIRDGAEPLVSTEVLTLPVKEGVAPRARNMLLPLAVMLFMMPLGLWVTGSGNLMAGSGSTSVLWAVVAATVTAGVMYRVQGIFKLGEIMDLVFRGLGGLMPVALLMMLAFAIGATCGKLETGIYVAGLASKLLRPAMVPVVLFGVSCLIAFSTGTSWGTFAIMLPIGIPTANLLGVPLPLALGAMLSGGVFGDHCSPISDTTIISSMSAGSDHMDHVNTQLPYALLVAGASAVLFAVAGLMQ